MISAWVGAHPLGEQPEKPDEDVWMGLGDPNEVVERDLRDLGRLQDLGVGRVRPAVEEGDQSHRFPVPQEMQDVLPAVRRQAVDLHPPPLDEVEGPAWFSLHEEDLPFSVAGRHHHRSQELLVLGAEA